MSEPGPRLTGVSEEAVPTPRRPALSPSRAGDFKQCPPGTHVARCIKLIDLGTQHGEWQGKPLVRQQIVVQWEVPGETVDTQDGPAPMIVSKFYTNSLSEKANLRADLEMWRGKQFTPEELGGFDLMKILNAACLVTVIHNEDGKARVKGVMALPKGTTCPPAHNKPGAFWIDEWDDNAFAALPEGFQKIIAQSDEYKAAFTPPAQTEKQQARAEMDDESIPF